jgi:transposase
MPKKSTRPKVTWHGVDLNDPGVRRAFEQWQIHHLGSANLDTEPSNILMLKDWRVLPDESTKTDDALYPAAAYEPPHYSPVCPKCGSIDDYIEFGRYKHSYVDLPIFKKQVHIQVMRQRYRCKACSATWMQPLPDMDSKYQMTRRCLAYLREESLEVTFTHLAAEVGVSDATIRRICKEFIAELEAQRVPYTPEWLGIDEVHIGGKYRGVITDIEKRRPVDLLITHSKPVVGRYLSNLETKKVKVVTCDMRGYFIALAEAIFPNATVIIDKFHVTTYATEAMDKARMRIKKKGDEKRKNQIWHERKLLLKRRSELSDSQRLRLEEWLQNYEHIGAVYQAKEQFCDLWLYPHPPRIVAEQRYRTWKEKLPEVAAPFFADLIQKVDNHHKQIFNYFDLDEVATNAYTESLNAITKEINRRGRGYSFDILRARLLFNRRRRPIVKDAAPWKQFGGSFYSDYSNVADEHRLVTNYDGSSMYMDEEHQFSFTVDEEGLERLKRIVPNAHIENGLIAFHIDDEELERVKEILAAEFGVTLLLNIDDENEENNTGLRFSESDENE